MSGLDDFRQKNPAYKNVPDAKLADALYKKYYTSIPRGEFDKKLGLAPAQAAGNPGVADTLTSADKGFDRFTYNYVERPLTMAASGLAGLPGDAWLGASKLIGMPFGIKTEDVQNSRHLIPTSGDIYNTFFARPEKFTPEAPASMGGRLAQMGLTGAAGVAMSGGTSLPAIASGGASGVLAQGAAEATDNPWAQMGAALLPLFFGHAVNAGKNAVTSMRKPFRAPGQEQIAGRILNSSAVEPNPNLPQVPLGTQGFKPTMSQLTGDPGLAQAERVLQAGAGTGGTAVNPMRVTGSYLDQKAQNVEAIKRAVAGQRDGGSPSDVAPVVRRVTEQNANTGSALMGQSQAHAHRGFTDVIGTPPAGSTVEQSVGTVIRDQLAAQRDNLATIRAREAGKTYGNVDASPAVVDLDPVTEVISQGLAKFENTGTGTAIESAQKALTLKSGALKTQMDQLQATLKDIRSQAGTLHRAGNKEGAYQVGQIADSLDAQINAADASLQTANTAYAAASRPLDPYTKPEMGNSATVLKPTRFGEGHVMDPEKVPGTYFNNGPTAASDMQEFQTLVGRNPQAVAAMRRYAAKSALDAARNPDGTINVTKFQKWSVDHADAIAQSPEIQRDLAQISQRLALQDRAAGQAEIYSTVPKEVQAWIQKDPAHAVRAVTGADNQVEAATRVWQTVGMDRPAQNGLRASYVDAFEAATVGAQGYKAEVARQFLNQTADMRKVWFTPEQNKVWDQIQSAVKMNEATGNAAVRGGSDSVQKLIGNKFLDVIVGRWVRPAGAVVGAGTGYLAGKLLPGVGEAAGTIAGPFLGAKAGGDMLSRAYAAPKGEIIDLLNRAMQDPQLAKALMMKANTPPKMVPKILRDYLEGVSRATPALAYRYQEAAE